MSATSTISSTFQISIPTEIRDHPALQRGKKVAFIANPDGYVIVPVPKREDLAVVARGANTDNHRDRNDRY